MVEVDPLEIILGVLGLVSGVYDSWVGDPRAPVFVTFAREAGLLSLLLGVLIAIIVLMVSEEIVVDATNLAIFVFAAGSLAPIIGRGAWSLIDMGTMFVDSMYVSYKETLGHTTYGKCDGERTPANNGGLPPGMCDKQKTYGFLKSSSLIFYALMGHNVSLRRFTPSYLAFSVVKNGEKFLRGVVADPPTSAAGSWDWTWKGWLTRGVALWKLLVLDFLVAVILLMQCVAVIVEGLILGIGSSWIAFALAAHMVSFAEESDISRERPLECVVRDLICGVTCPTGHLCVGPESPLQDEENTKLLSAVMIKIRVKSARGKQEEPRIP